VKRCEVCGSPSDAKVDRKVLLAELEKLKAEEAELDAKVQENLLAQRRIQHQLGSG
jgi:hypothetical protein